MIKHTTHSDVSDTTNPALKSKKLKRHEKILQIRLQLLPALSTSLAHAKFPTDRTNPTPHAIAAEIEEGD